MTRTCRVRLRGGRGGFTRWLLLYFHCFVPTGKIACANVLSDLYAMGVVDCDNMLMLLCLSTPCNCMLLSFLLCLHSPQSGNDAGAAFSRNPAHHEGLQRCARIDRVSPVLI